MHEIHFDLLCHREQPVSNRRILELRLFLPLKSLAILGDTLCCKGLIIEFLVLALRPSRRHLRLRHFLLLLDTFCCLGSGLFDTLFGSPIFVVSDAFEHFAPVF